MPFLDAPSFAVARSGCFGRASSVGCSLSLRFIQVSFLISLLPAFAAETRLYPCGACLISIVSWNSTLRAMRLFAALPSRPGVLLIEMTDSSSATLFGYRTADIRRAAERLLQVPETLGKRLNLRARLRSASVSGPPAPNSSKW